MPDFLAGLAAHRLFDGLARLDEARKARPHARRKARTAAEQAALAVDREHDDDGIGARKMLRAAGRAVAPPAGVDDAARRPAIGTEAVARMPAEHRLRLGERRQMLRREKRAGRDRPQIGDEKIAAALEGFDGRLVDARRKSRRAVEQAEKHFLAPWRERCRLGKREGRILAAAARVRWLVCDDDFAADEMDARPRIGLERRDGGGVLPPIGGAIERICGVAEERRDPEIRA